MLDQRDNLLQLDDWWTKKEQWMLFVFLYFGNAFDTVSHIIPTDKLMKYGLDEWKVRWIDNTKQGGVADTPDGRTTD